MRTPVRGVAAMGNGAIAVVCGNRITRNVRVRPRCNPAAATIKSEQDNMVDGNNMGGPQASGALTALAGV